MSFIGKFLRAGAPALAILSFSLANVRAGAESDIRLEKVFGAEAPGPYKHPASFAELDNGEIYLVYYGGAGEYATETAVYGARLKKGETAWSTPKPIADTPFTSEGNGVVWQAPDGLVWLFYVVRYGETWSDSRVQAKISRDGAQTWSDPMILAFEPGMMARNRPITLMDGRFMLPIYYETGHDTEAIGKDSVSLFLIHDPKTRTWTRSGPIRSAQGNIQPGVVQLTDKHLIAYCRRGGGYDPTTEGWAIRSESNDGGMTWSEGKNSAFKNPNAALDFIKLANGHLLMVFNDNMNDRDPLTVSVSTDGDATWPHSRDLVAGEAEPWAGDYAYPVAAQFKDGSIHVIFTSRARAQINHAVFEESAILGHKK